MTKQARTPPYFRYTVRLIRPFPNIDLPGVKLVRQAAADLLQLTPGDRVLDAGCGPGACFPILWRAVGASGEIVGVEISPEVAINARRRVERNGWTNVRVVEADARSATFAGKFDGLLCFGVSDIYAHAATLDHLLAQLKPGARVVAFGWKLTRRRAGVLLNPALRTLRKLTFDTTPALELEPWSLLESRLESFRTRDHWLGSMFMGWGRLPSPGGVEHEKS